MTLRELLSRPGAAEALDEDEDAFDLEALDELLDQGEDDETSPERSRSSARRSSVGCSLWVLIRRQQRADHPVTSSR